MFIENRDTIIIINDIQLQEVFQQEYLQMKVMIKCIEMLADHILVMQMHIVHEVANQVEMQIQEDNINHQAAVEVDHQVVLEVHLLYIIKGMMIAEVSNRIHIKQSSIRQSHDISTSTPIKHFFFNILFFDLLMTHSVIFY